MMPKTHAINKINNVKLITKVKKLVKEMFSIYVSKSSSFQSEYL